MKLYSTPEKPLAATEDSRNKPAPYNWLFLLLIFIGYILFAVLS